MCVEVFLYGISRGARIFFCMLGVSEYMSFTVCVFVDVSSFRESRVF